MSLDTDSILVTRIDSGHGGLTKDLDGDEESGYDEVIYPVDFKQNGQIIDDVGSPGMLCQFQCTADICCRSCTTFL